MKAEDVHPLIWIVGVMLVIAAYLAWFAPENPDHLPPGCHYDTYQDHGGGVEGISCP